MRSKIITKSLETKNIPYKVKKRKAEPDFQGGRPPMMGGETDFEAQEKYNAKQNKKLRKILGDDLHRQWRTKHPQERPKLPDIELQ